MYLATIAIAAGAMGCDAVEEARVTIVYDQVANFATYSLTGSGSTGASPNVFIMYRIRSISNTGSEAAPFTFDRDAAVTITSSHTINGGPLDSTQNILLDSQSINTLSVAAGTNVSASPGLGCIIVYARADDPSEINNTSSLVELFHQIDPEQPVSMTRAADDTSTAIILGAALPSAPNVGLQQLCNTTRSLN